jgi:glutamate-ammonia-ligase adenylyltransferase
VFDTLIQESFAPARVRAAIDLILSTGAPLPAMDAEGLRRFRRVAEHSAYAIDVLRSFDEAWPVLIESATPALPCTAAPTIVRRFLALAHLRAIVLDLCDARPIGEVTAHLAATADVCVGAAVALAAGELAAQYGLPAGAVSPAAPGLAVLGMGKLGGCELNFSSDIDLVFVYGEDGETSGGSRGVLATETWQTRLVQRVVDLLSSRLISPFAYRVDLRLRPEGKSGPLVRSLDATLRYYEREGSAWERQAYLKARVIAGDRDLGERLLAGLEPFVYKKYLDRESIFQIEAIKARIEAQVAEHGPRHIKLSVGGIREIEFVVQILQLAHGGRSREVRRAATIEALERLEANGFLLDGDCEVLEEAYLFLRLLEHRLQILDARQTHLLPEDPAEMDDLAARMGFVSGEALWRRYREATAGVRRFYERRFARSKEISVTSIEERVMEILDEGCDEKVLASAAAGLDFDEIAIREIRRMARGSIHEPPSSALRLNFIRSSAVWLPQLEALPAPTEGLARLGRMIEAYGAKATVYAILAAQAPVAELLVNIASLSTPLTERICRDPSALEALLSPGGVTGRRSREELAVRLAAFERVAPDPIRAGQVVQSEERLRIGVRFLMGIASAEESGAELAILAELLIGAAPGGQAVPSAMCDILSPPRTLVPTRPPAPRRALFGGVPDFAVVALGRFGLGDLGFGSDLDLVFVADEREDRPRHVQERIEAWERLGLTIDARLRPMGRTGPVVTTIEGLRDYFDREAATWERIAWARARVLVAPDSLRDPLGRMIRGFVLDAPWDDSHRAELCAMRARILAERAVAEDLKKGPGGMIDLDFEVAVRRIESGQESLRPEELLADRPALLRSYRYLRALEASAWIVTGRGWKASLEENDRRRIETVLRRQGFDPDELAAARETIRRETAWGGVL